MTESGGGIRVLLADDHTMFRQGLKEMLSTDEGIEVVGEAKNGAEAVDLAQDLRPDVVVLDVEMPIMGARGAMDGLFEISPPPKVVVVTMHDDPTLVRELLRRGASAYLMKSASLEELLAAVHAAAESPEENGDVGSPAREESVVMVVPREVFERAERSVDEGGVSPRELEILMLVARGLSNRQISRTLNVAEATVKRHLANLYPKINVGSRGEATRMALAEGWISARDVTGGERAG